jgi:hypothetical protein
MISQVHVDIGSYAVHVSLDTDVLVWKIEGSRVALGRKTGGREKGTPNKRTHEVQEMLAELDCDPIQGMARIAMDEANSPELRGRMLAELAQYAYPKRKAVEIIEQPEPEVSGVVLTLAEVLTPQELQELKARMLAAEAKKTQDDADAQALVATSEPIRAERFSSFH